MNNVLRLNIANLAAGHYEESRQAQAADLDLQEYAEFQSPVDMVLHIDKASDELIVTIGWKTVIYLNCDRCAEPLETALSDSYSVVFTFNPKEHAEEDEEVLLISESTREVDLTAHLRESLILALPVKQLCREECKGLCGHCGANLNSETCTCQPGPVYPRWEKLEQLLKRKN